jgi:type III secretion protein Q
VTIAFGAGSGRSAPLDREARPLPMCRMTQAEVHLVNIWHRRWRVGTVDLAGMRLGIWPTVATDIRSSGPAVVLGLTIDDSRAELAVPATVIDRVLRALAAPSRDALSDTSMLLLIELAGAALLDAMEQALALPVTLTDFRMEAPRDAPEGLALAGTLADLAFTAWLAWPKERADMLAMLLGKGEPIRGSDITIDVALRVGTTRLAVGPLASLIPGDVVVLDCSALKDDRLAVVYGERRLAFASLQGARVTLTTGLTAISGDMHRIWTAADYIMMNDDPTGVTDLDDIQVTLLFEIGRLAIPLGELRTLASGHVFDLGRDPKGAIEILAGGRRIGHGEVVQIGDAIGVRIVRIFDRD